MQGGDPTGTGSGGESVYGTPFKVELWFTWGLFSIDSTVV